MYQKVLIAGAVGVAIASVRQGAKVFNQHMNDMDQLAKKAKELGTDTEFLSRLGFASEQTTSLSSDQAIKGVEKFTRRISEAAHGMGEAQGVLRELGLDAQTLARLGPDKAIMKVARAMDVVTESGDRMRISTKLLDDEAAGMHVLFKKSNAEIEALFAKSDKLGRTVSSFDASQMERANEAMTSVNSSLESFGRLFATTIGPTVTQMLHEINRTLEELNKSANSQQSGPRDETPQYTTGDFMSGYWRALTSRQSSPLTGGSSLGMARVAAEGFVNARDDRLNRAAVFKNQRRESYLRFREQKKAESDRPEKLRQAYMGALTEFTKDFKMRISSPDDPFGKAEKQQFNFTDFGRMFSAEFMEQARQYSPDDPFGMRDSDSKSFDVLSEVQDPMESIAAGSSEAFKLQYQTTAARSVEIDTLKQTAASNAKIATSIGEVESMIREISNEKPVDLF